jgi:hypothetical protein
VLSAQHTHVSTDNRKPRTSNLVANSINPSTPIAKNKSNMSQPNRLEKRPKMNALDYNVIDHPKKTKANISLFDIYALPQQCGLLLDTFNPDNSQKKLVVVAENISKFVEAKEEQKVEIKSVINAISIGPHLKSQVPPFLLTYEIFNFNVHNCLVDFGASSNIMPYSF